jgi:hypothetical protein
VIEEARAELRSAMRRILELLRRRVAAQRENAPPADSGPLRGIAIDECEAEMLVGELVADLERPERLRAAAPAEVPAANPTQRGRELPWQHARRVFGLNRLDLDAMVLALAVELDQRFARLVAYLNDHIAKVRPTVGLVLSLTGSEVSAVEFCQQRAVRYGLLKTEGDGPLSALALRMAPEFLPRLGAPGTSDGLPPGLRLRREPGTSLQELIAGVSDREKLRRWAGRIRDGRARLPMVMSGAPGAGRATAVQAASAAAGCSLLETVWAPGLIDRGERLGVAAREALWRDATLLVRIPEGPADTDLSGLWAALSGWDLPVALALAPEQTESACSAAPVEPVVIQLDGTSIEDRDALWQRLLLVEAPDVEVSLTGAERMELAARFDFRPGALARAIRRAASDRVDGSEPLDFESLSRACRIVGSASIGPIAQRLPQPYTRSDLILPQELLHELDLAAAWMRHRRQVFEDWGFEKRIVLGRGLTALFTGEPGTGKTMAAQVLARELGLDLFRVDLSRVMSKYIGETEKNLSRLFDEARASGAILFFDEADALFGKRTEVKDAHDRYANLEIGYLLQRMEEHAGTTVLATNRVGDLDEAFTRRFHFILDFPMPRAPERVRIWQGMLPLAADREPGIELDQLARDYEVSGGEIRNSVLIAAFLAAKDGVPIGLPHLKRGLRRELLKSGRVLDGKQRRDLEGG